MTLEEILSQYAGLLIVQYKNKPKASLTVKLLVNQNLCDGLPLTEQTCFDLETAIGAQLTILGKIVGVPREVYGLDLSHTYWSFTRYSGTPAGTGWGRYSDVAYPTELFLRYNSFATYTMSDFELRTAIKLKIIYNNKFSSLKNIKEALYRTFAGDINVIDASISRDYSSGTFLTFTRYSGSPAGLGFGRYDTDPYPTDLFYRYAYYRNMFLYYEVKSIYRNAFLASIYLNIVPRPMGVTLQADYI